MPRSHRVSGRSLHRSLPNICTAVLDYWTSIFSQSHCEAVLTRPCTAFQVRNDCTQTEDPDTSDALQARFNARTVCVFAIILTQHIHTFVMAPLSHYHVFSLPRELLETLIPRNVVHHPPTPPRARSPSLEQNNTNTSGRACNVCLGAVFSDVESQRTHFHSDWHRYNVKIRLNGSQPVTEVQFSKLVDGTWHVFAVYIVWTHQYIQFCRTR